MKNPLMEMGKGEVNPAATAWLRASKLYARSNGSKEEAFLQAGYYAKKDKHTIYVYRSNFHGAPIYRSTYKKSEVLDPINNNGSSVFAVSPDLTVTVHPVTRGTMKNPTYGTHPTALAKAHTAEGLLARMLDDGADTFAKKVKWVAKHIPTVDDPQSFVGWVTASERKRKQTRVRKTRNPGVVEVSVAGYRG